MESESGLKALFQSAREFEEERAEARGGGGDAKPGGEDDRRPATATATAREEGGERAKPTKPATAAAALPITAASLAEKRALEKEVRRLVSERAELMATGAYSSSDRVIELIDEKIAEITAAVAKS
jgi:centrosomal protein CEP120